METLWWTSRAALGRAAVLAVTGYAGPVLIVRTAGFPAMKEVYAVVLEPDAEMSVIGGGRDRGARRT